MKKRITLTESDLTNIIQRVINEQENSRVRSGYSISDYDFVRFNSMGVTPYYYDSQPNGQSSMIEITKENLKNHKEERIFLLYPEEYEKISNKIDSLNEVIEKYLRKIELLQEMIPTILVEEIMVD
jgi:hypothetical protein